MNAADHARIWRALEKHYDKMAPANPDSWFASLTQEVANAYEAEADRVKHAMKDDWRFDPTEMSDC